MNLVLVGLGLPAITVTESKGFGGQRGHTEAYRGAESTIEYIPKARIEVLTAAGQIGDGKVWITPLDTIIRVRTRAINHDAS